MKTRLLLIAMVLGFAFMAAARVPQIKHVVLLVEENHSFEAVITQGGMPYLKSLADQNSLLTNYYSDYHPSLGNYLMMTTGTAISTDDGYGGTYSGENIVSQLIAAKKTWKLYADSLPRAGYVGGNRSPYAKKHNPIAYFDVVVNDDQQRMNIVPFEQFSADLKSAQGLPDFSMIIPDEDHDAHDGTLQEADDWLKTNVSPLLQNPEFQKDGILIITFDESFKSDKAHGGGHVPTVVIGAGVKEHYTDTNYYRHESLFATLEEALGVPRLKIVENATTFSDTFK
ncbi:MAG TPA: alkaline phosphatase family protein [Terriglobales bacterium]|nr:alkaline phosphatase family protein [Terriglobales bacterium]